MASRPGYSILPTSSGTGWWMVLRVSITSFRYRLMDSFDHVHIIFFLGKSKVSKYIANRDGIFWLIFSRYHPLPLGYPNKISDTDILCYQLCGVRCSSRRWSIIVLRGGVSTIYVKKIKCLFTVL